MKGAIEKYAPVRAVPTMAQREHEQHETDAVAKKTGHSAETDSGGGGIALPVA